MAEGRGSPGALCRREPHRCAHSPTPRIAEVDRRGYSMRRNDSPPSPSCRPRVHCRRMRLPTSSWRRIFVLVPAPAPRPCSPPATDPSFFDASRSQLKRQGGRGGGRHRGQDRCCLGAEERILMHLEERSALLEVVHLRSHTREGVFVERKGSTCADS